MSNRLVLSHEQMSSTLGNFYTETGKAAGYKETEDTMYDCSKINIAVNVQDAIIKTYLKKYPEMAEHDVLIYLAISGPKADEQLPDNMVEIFEGFFTK